MSSDADAATALFSSIYTEHYCQMAACILFIYDAFVTFEREVACFWAKRGGASLLFFANRWISMTLYIMVLVGFVTFPSDKRLVYGHAELKFVPAAIFSALRAYVLSRSKLLGLLVLTLSLVPVGANAAVYGYQLSGENFPPFGCLQTGDVNATVGYCSHAMAHTHPENYAVIIISRVPLIVADVLLIYITWAKLDSRGALRDMRQSKRLSLSDVLFRDGTMYFVVLLILNVLHLVLSATAIATNSESSYVSYFTGPLTATLISRFLLDLQEVNQAVVRLDADDALHSSRDPYDTPSFISPLGAFINPDLPATSDNELEWDVGSGSGGEEEGGIQVSQCQVAASSSSP
ncbi:hypothetical protein C8T65DRAFT_739401 [Cerioporus squamosus]|nr:hypothetical protein C8T65DRAFT_739401 [Cerioporus squamosus]